MTMLLCWAHLICRSIMICLLSTFSVYTLTPLTLRGCTTNTQRHDESRQWRHKHFPLSRLALSTSSTLFLTQRRNYLCNQRICLRRARVFRCMLPPSLPTHPFSPPHPTSCSTCRQRCSFFVCLLVLSALLAVTTHHLSEAAGRRSLSLRCRSC